MIGPSKVQSRIAQVTTRNSSVLPPSPKTSLASATELIRKPISPRATIALPRIAAGYSDLGLGSAVRLRVVFASGLLSGVDKLPSGASWMFVERCRELLLRRIAVFCGRWSVAGIGFVRGDFSLVSPEVSNHDFMIPVKEDNPFDMSFARGMEANRTSQKPQIILAKTMRIVYTSPRQITRPVNILVIGIANPIEAKKRGRKIDSTAGE